MAQEGWPPGSDRRPARPPNAPPDRSADTPVPLALGDRRIHTALPVGVRDGDVLIIPIGCEGLTDEEADYCQARIVEALGVAVKIVFLEGVSSVTVLRPEKSA